MSSIDARFDTVKSKQLYQFSQDMYLLSIPLMPTDLLSYSACLHVRFKVFLNITKYHRVFKDRIMGRS